MRRFSSKLLLVLLLLVPLLAACGASPKSKASDWSKRFPAEIGSWEADDKRLELTAENQSNYGHVTLTYTNEDDVVAYISIDTYATQTAADVEMARRLRESELAGIRFDRKKINAQDMELATTAGGYVGYYQVGSGIITLSVIAPVVETAEGETTESTFAPLPMDEIELLLETMAAVGKEVS